MDEIQFPVTCIASSYLRPLLIAGLLLAISVCATDVRAGIVYFENPPFGEEGHFDWMWQRRDEEESPFNWLDITRPSFDQGEMSNGSSVGQLFSGGSDSMQNWTFEGAFVARVPDLRLTRALAAGDPVEQERDFQTTSFHVLEPDDLNSDFKEGVPAYIGVRTESGNFGWIHVVRGVEGERREFLAIGWAYETIPGKGIRAGEIPTPGTVAALAFGAALTPRRKRQS